MITRCSIIRLNSGNLKKENTSIKISTFITPKEEFEWIMTYMKKTGYQVGHYKGLIYPNMFPIQTSIKP